MSHTILVIAEHNQSALRRVTLEALQAAIDVVSGSSGTVHCFIAGKQEKELQASAEHLLRHGAQHCYLAVDEYHDSLQALTSLPPLLVVIEDLKPDFIIAGHTVYGRELAPRLAARLASGYIADVTAIRVENEQVLFTRPIYAGKAFETRLFQGSSPHIVTLRPNNFLPADEKNGELFTDLSEAISLANQPAAPLSVIVESVAKRISKGIDLTEADIIVAGGRGVQGSEGFKLLQELADELGGAVGASRGACDAGYCDYSMQIGQTGKVVTPKLYIACGISGAIQHVAGMSQSHTIVAINKDPEAPIFSIADYGIVGDLFEIVPLLTAELKKLQANC
ncbi:electron transfer flavoprotein subunit alpha/FixB family protein [Paenibacillus septentrionalis]|uniref:Electron transfer flavoprotein subunit alpha/FixB family protein n=1 Tax=Paenibacillus septentrionalis TaxID=429342 RepID=A0ABW1V793_9BACL